MYLRPWYILCVQFISLSREGVAKYIMWTLLRVILGISHNLRFPPFLELDSSSDSIIICCMVRPPNFVNYGRSSLQQITPAWKRLCGDDTPVSAE